MSSICPTCTKRVYVAEGVKACDKLYHKLCLQCEHCHKILQLGQYSEREGKPYCKTDYDRLFRTAGFRAGGVADSYDAQPKQETTTVQPVIETTVHEERPAEIEFQLFPTNCPRCSKKAYENEKKVYNGRDWHRTCFTCFACNKSLVSGSYSENKGLIYCPRCYESRYGAKGFGAGKVLH